MIIPCSPCRTAEIYYAKTWLFNYKNNKTPAFSVPFLFSVVHPETIGVTIAPFEFTDYFLSYDYD